MVGMDVRHITTAVADVTNEQLMNCCGFWNGLAIKQISIRGRQRKKKQDKSKLRGFLLLRFC